LNRFLGSTSLASAIISDLCPSSPPIHHEQPC
jgi:hypothetical protein